MTRNRKYTSAATIATSLATLLATSFVCVSSAAAGEGLKPGKWDFTTIFTMKAALHSKTEHGTTCITSEDNEAVWNLTDHETCRVRDKSTEGNTVRWTLECKGPSMGGSGASENGSVAHAEFTSNGDTAKGKISMDVMLLGQSVAAEKTWEGKRVGDCP